MKTSACCHDDDHHPMSYCMYVYYIYSSMRRLLTLLEVCYAIIEGFVILSMYVVHKARVRPSEENSWTRLRYDTYDIRRTRSESFYARRSGGYVL